MCQPTSKVSINVHLRNLYNLSYCLGLISFTFNPLKNKFEISKRLAIVSSAVFTLLTWVFGSLVLYYGITAILIYTNVKSFKSTLSAIETQDTVLREAEVICHVIAGLLLGLNLRKLRSKVLPSLNKILSILQNVDAQPDAVVYIEPGLAKFLFLRIWILDIVMLCKVVRCVFLLFVFSYIIATTDTLHRFLFFLNYVILGVLMCYVQITSTVIHLGHLCSQLVLLDIYARLNDVLALPSSYTSCGRLRKSLHASFELHRIKKDLDDFFRVSYCISYLRAFIQVQNLYELLKVILYTGKSFDATALLSRILYYFPLFAAQWFDIYLIGRLSDKLVQKHRRFQDIVLAVFLGKKLFKKKRFECKMTLELLQTQVYGLYTRIFGLNNIDQKFAFDYLMTLILAFVISLLQYYAGEKVYKPDTSVLANITQLHL